MAVETEGQSQLVSELLGRIGETVGGKADVATIFGEPVQREGVTVRRLGHPRGRPERGRIRRGWRRGCSRWPGRLHRSARRRRGVQAHPYPE